MNNPIKINTIEFLDPLRRGEGVKKVVKDIKSLNKTHTKLIHIHTKTHTHTYSHT